MNIFTFTKLGRTLLLLAVVMVGSLCVSNGDRPAGLVGQWVSVKDGKSVELFKDGTGVIGNQELKWKTEGKRFVLSYGGEMSVGAYNLSGYELKRTFENGSEIVWVKKDKVEEYKKKKADAEQKEAQKKAEAELKEAERAKKEAEQRHEKISSYFTDSRDGQKYRTVKIGGKTWMAENLNYQMSNSWCYENDESKCKQYGRLYDWNTARTACPSGWHLPSRKEWNDMVTVAGGDVAGKKLKSTYGWAGNGNGTDEFGFWALPGGCRDTDGSFSSAGEYGSWWTATENGGRGADFRRMDYDYDDVGTHYGVKGAGFSLRCRED